MGNRMAEAFITVGYQLEEPGKIRSRVKKDLDDIGNAAKVAINFRLENELRQLAQAEQKTNDLAKAWERVNAAAHAREAVQPSGGSRTSPLAQIEEQNARHAEAAIKRRQAMELTAAAIAEQSENDLARTRRANEAAGEAAIRRRQAMELTAVAVAEQAEADLARRRRQSDAMIGVLYPGAAAAGAAGGAAGGRHYGGAGGRMGMAAIQASYGVQDLVTVMAAGGNFQQGMVAMSNNLGAMLTMTGGLAGAVGGLGITLAALSIEPLYKWFTKTEDAAARLEERLKGIAREAGMVRFRDDQSLQGFKLGVDVRRAEEDRRSRKSDANGEGLEGDKFPALERDRELRTREKNIRDEQQVLHEDTKKKQKRQVENENGSDRELVRRYQDSLARRQEYERKYVGDKPGLAREAAARFMAEQAETGIMGNRSVWTGRAGETIEDQKKAAEAAQERITARQKEIDENKERAKQLVKDRESIQGERKKYAEEYNTQRAQKIRERVDKFDRDISETTESGNEFKNRRTAALRRHEETQERINRETVGLPEERARLSASNQVRTNAAWKDIAKDEQQAKSRFLRQMESNQRGTGSVAAIREELEENLAKATKMFGAGTAGEKGAQQQALATAQAETQRIINASRPKGGDFLGIADLSRHIQSQISKGDPDQKKIQQNTFDAAQALKEMLQKWPMGAVAGP